jgi:hypothetical protein
VDRTKTEIAGDFEFRRRLLGKTAQRIHVGGVNAGVVEGGLDGAAGQLQFRGRQRFRKFGGADADDGGAVFEHVQPPCSGAATPA